MGIISEIDSAFSIYQKIRSSVDAANSEELINKIISIKMLAVELQSENFSLKQKFTELKNRKRIETDYKHIKVRGGFALVKSTDADGIDELSELGGKKVQLFCQFCGADGKLIGLTDFDDGFICRRCDKLAHE